MFFFFIRLCMKERESEESGGVSGDDAETSGDAG